MEKVRYEIDFNDINALWDFALETERLAEEYKQVREEFASAIKTLKLGLAEAFLQGTIKENISEEKAYLFLSNINEVYKEALINAIKLEQVYKGLEKLIDARQSVISFNQSIIKTVPKSASA